MAYEPGNLTHPPCYAAESPLECEAAGIFCVRTRKGEFRICEKHLRLVLIKLEREGLSPCLETLPPAAARA